MRTLRLAVSRKAVYSPQLAILALVLSFTADFVGRLGDDGIVRIKPGTAESVVFVQPGATGSRTILVFADERVRNK